VIKPTPSPAFTAALPGTERLYDRNFVIAFISQSLFVVANAGLAHYGRWISFLGGDELDIGLVMGAGPIVSLFLRPWTGPWIDRVGARATLGIGYISFMAIVCANLLLTDIGPFVYVLRAATVVSAALVFSSGLAYVSQTCPPSRRTEAIGTLGAGGFIGMLIGPAGGDYLLGGANRGRSHFDFYFLAASVSVLLALVLLIFLRPTPPNAHRTPIRLSEFVRAVRRYFPGSILLVDFVFGLCMTIPFVFLSDYCDEIGMGGIGPFFFAYAGWGLCVRLVFRRLPDLIGRRKVLVAGLCFFAVGMFCFLIVDASQPRWLVVPALLCGTGHGLTFHTMVGLTLEPFPIQNHGTGSVLALMHLDLGTITGAPILGWVARHMGYNSVFLIVGGACLVVAAIYTAASLGANRATPSSAAS
jgi:MFS family permease